MWTSLSWEDIVKTLRRIGVVAANGVLLLALVGLLVAYVAIASDLPSRVYTANQQAFLDYNMSRSVAQAAPKWEVTSGDVVVSTALPGQDSRVRAVLTARYEEKDGVSVTVYDLDFAGEYRLSHTGALSTTVGLYFPFPSNLETLHEVRFLVDGVEPLDAQYTTQGIGWQTVLAAGEEHLVEISYKADGASSFAYGLHHNQRSDVDVVVTVNGLSGSVVSSLSLPASAHEITEEGEVWLWDYDALIADRDIRLSLPARLSFAQRVAQLQDDFRTLAGLAPVFVVAFLASLAGVFYLDGVRLPFATYLLAGCGLALFYPLLTFLSGMVDLVVAALLALVLVSALLVAFVGKTAGWRQGGWRVGLLLLVFVGFFSLGVLTPWRGLLLTLGALLLVGAFMLLYARRPREMAPNDDTFDPMVKELSVDGQSEPATELLAGTLPGPETEMPLEDAAPADPHGPHCPYCSRSLAEDYAYCPGCGHDTSDVFCCAVCGHRQFVPAGLAIAHCVHCGASIAEHTRASTTDHDRDAPSQ
jgi:hypothetical protein